MSTLSINLFSYHKFSLKFIRTLLDLYYLFRFRWGLLTVRRSPNVKARGVRHKIGTGPFGPVARPIVHDLSDVVPLAARNNRT